MSKEKQNRNAKWYDLRFNQGKSVLEIAIKNKVHPNTVYKVLDRERKRRSSK